MNGRTDGWDSEKHEIPCVILRIMLLFSRQESHVGEANNASESTCARGKTNHESGKRGIMSKKHMAQGSRNTTINGRF